MNTSKEADDGVQAQFYFYRMHIIKLKLKKQYVEL